MPFSNPFKRSKETYNPVVEGYTQQILASQDPPDAASQAAKDALEINIHTIEDTTLLRQLEKLSITPEQTYSIPIYDPLDPTKPPRMETITIPSRPVPWALAARVAMSKVMSTRFFEKRDCIIYKNRLRNDFLKIKRGMSREDRNLFVPLLNEIEMFCLTALDDSVNGQKMLALKTSGRNLRVGVSNGNGGK